MHGVVSLFGIRTCAESILGFLPRSSLKSLRLTCTAIDDAVVAESDLFSRAYISANHRDLEVLKEMSHHPRIASRVTTLVWDVTIINGVSYGDGDPEKMATGQRIVSGFHIISGEAQEFPALLSALQRFPRLNGVVFVPLMGHWLQLSHNEDEEHDQARLWGTYISPAMKQWRLLGLYRQQPSTYLDRSSPMMLEQVESWGQSLLAGSESESQAMPSSLEMVLMVLQYMPVRAPALFLIAMRVLNRSLRSFRVEGGEIQYVKYGSFDFKLSPRDLMLLGNELGWFDGMFRQLHEVCLYLPPETAPGTGPSFPSQLVPTLQNVRTLELRVWYKCLLQDSDIFLIPHGNLQVLILEGFHIEQGMFRDVLLPWCFEGGVESLQLVNCVFNVPKFTYDIHVLRWLFDKDISGQGYNVHGPDTVIHSPGTGDELSDSDEGESDVQEIETVPFCEKDLGPEPDDDSETDSDPEYLPCCPEMVHDRQDAPFSSPTELVDYFYEHYHEAELAAYDNDYPEDILDIRPAPISLWADPSRACFEFRFDGASWGCPGKNRVLHLLIDGLTTSEYFYLHPGLQP